MCSCINFVSQEKPHKEKITEKLTQNDYLQLKIQNTFFCDDKIKRQAKFAISQMFLRQEQ